MEELNLKELFNIFWRKKLDIILIILIFILLGVIYTVGFTKPMYSSSTTLVLASTANVDEQASTTITTTDITLNSKLVSTYSELVKSKNVLRQVISNLGIEINEDTLRKSITVSSVKNTELIEITVKNENPEYAAKIANEIAEVFIEKVKEIYNISNVQVVDKAEESEFPSNINHSKDIIIFAFIGVVVAACYVLIENMLDTTIKTTEDIERGFKVPVLASIPIYETDIQKIKGKGGRR